MHAISAIVLGSSLILCVWTCACLCGSGLHVCVKVNMHVYLESKGQAAI